MTDEWIMNFEAHLSKTMDQHEGNATMMKRAMLYILAPILKLSTINAVRKALRIEKDCLYRMLGSKNQHEWLKLLRSFSYTRAINVLQRMQNLHESNQSRNRLTISVDDTAYASSGKRMPLVGLLWDSVLKRVKLGTQGLYFQVTVGDQKSGFPLDLRLCRGKGRRGRPTTSKVDLVVTMMKEFHRAIVAAGCSPDHIVFVADSWFNAGAIFTAARQCGFSLVTKSKCSFVFTVKGRSVKVAALLNQEHDWRTSDGNAPRRYARYAAVHGDFGAVILTIFDDDGARVCLISNNPDHASPKIIADFKLRWPIEVFFKDCKQRLGVKRFGFQSRAKIYGHFVLRALTYHLLDWMRTKLFRRRKTIGECCDWLYRNILLNPDPQNDKLGLRTLKSYVPEFR